jgi:hypothetical protein
MLIWHVSLMKYYLLILQVGNFSNTLIEVICANCPKLRELNLNGCSELGQDTLTHIAKYKPQLRKLHIECCTGLDQFLNSYLFSGGFLIDNIIICPSCFLFNPKFFVKSKDLDINIHVTKECASDALTFNLFD